MKHLNCSMISAGHSVQTPCPQQGHLEEVSQDHAQLAFEYVKYMAFLQPLRAACAGLSRRLQCEPHLALQLSCTAVWLF